MRIRYAVKHLQYLKYYSSQYKDKFDIIQNKMNHDGNLFDETAKKINRSLWKQHKSTYLSWQSPTIAGVY